MLAVQNMDARNAVHESHEIEFKALEGSLNMMSKGWPGTTPLECFSDGARSLIVLNDVLDLWVHLSDDPERLLTSGSHRMDSGKFESYNKVAHRSTLSVCSIMTSSTALCLPPNHAVPDCPPQTRCGL